MACDLLAFDEHVAPLRPPDVIARASKHARNKLRLEHGEFLAKFTVQALSELPREATAAAELSERVVRLSECASEAARLVVALSAFKSPEPEKLCYNVAARCLALRRYALAEELASVVLGALRREEETTPPATPGRAHAKTPGRAPARAVAKTPAKTPAKAKGATDAAAAEASSDPLAPAGGESAAACELALTAACVWLRALEAVASEDSSHGARLEGAVAAVLCWLDQSHATGAAAGKENAAAAPQRGATARLAPQLMSAIRLLRKRGVDADQLEAWERKALQRCGDARQAPHTPLLSTPRKAPESCRSEEEAAWAHALRELKAASLASGETRGVERQLAAALEAARKACSPPASECARLAPPLHELYVYYSSHLGALPLRVRRGPPADKGGPAASLLAALARGLERYAAVLRVLASLAESGEASMRKATLLAGVLVGAAKLSFHSEAAADAPDCSAEELPSDWAPRVASELRAAAVAICAAPAAEPAAWPLQPPRAAEGAAWMGRLTRVAQQLAARLFNSSQPRRAYVFAQVSSDFSLLVGASSDGNSADGACGLSTSTALTGVVSALHMLSHCALQMKPPLLDEALEHAGAAICARIDLVHSPDPSAAPDSSLQGAAALPAQPSTSSAEAPPLKDLIALHVSIQTQLLISSNSSSPANAQRETGNGKGAKTLNNHRLKGKGKLVEDSRDTGDSDLARAGQFESAFSTVVRERTGKEVQLEHVAVMELEAIARQLIRYAATRHLFIERGCTVADEALARLPAHCGPLARARVLLSRAELWQAAAAAAVSPAASSSAGSLKTAECARAERALAEDDESRCIQNAEADAREALAVLQTSSGGEAASADESVRDIESRGCFDGLKVKDMREELQRRGLSTTGKREQLLERLQTAEADGRAAMDEDDAPTSPGGAKDELSTPRSEQPLELKARALMFIAEAAMLRGSRKDRDEREASQASEGGLHAKADDFDDEHHRLASSAHGGATGKAASAKQEEMAVDVLCAATSAAVSLEYQAAAEAAVRAVGMWSQLFDAASNDAMSTWSAARLTTTTNDLVRCSRLLWQLMLEEAAVTASHLAGRLACTVLGVASGQSTGSAEQRTRDLAGCAALRWEVALLSALGQSRRAMERLERWAKLKVASSMSEAGERTNDASREVALCEVEQALGVQELDGMRRRLLAAHAKLKRGGAPSAICACLLSLAYNAAASGAPTQSLRYAQEALRVAMRPMQGDGCERQAQSHACETLLLLCRLWTKLGSSVDAKRYARSALDLARRCGMVRMKQEALLATVMLHIEAEQLGAAELVTKQLLNELLVSDAASGSRAPTLLHVHVGLARAELALRRRQHSTALEQAEVALGLADRMDVDSSAKLVWLKASLLAAGASAMRALNRDVAAMGSLEKALELLNSIGPFPLGAARSRVLLEVGLLHLSRARDSGEIDALWGEPSRPRGARASCAGCALNGARKALLEALQHGVNQSTLTYWRQTCLAAALCCGLLHQSAGARLVAEAIGRGVHEQMHLLRYAAESTGTEALNEAMEALTMENANTSSCKLSKASSGKRGFGEKAVVQGNINGAEKAWSSAMHQIEVLLCPFQSDEPNRIDDWISTPPADCTVSAVALAPEQHGLLIARWRRESPPMLTLVAETCAVEDGTGATSTCSGELLRELQAIMEEDACESISDLALREIHNRDTHVEPPSAAKKSSSGSSAASFQLGEKPSERTMGSTKVELVGRTSEGKETRIALNHTRKSIVIGRAQKGACRVNHPQVSSSHCTVAFDPETGKITLTDTSTNGTFVDGSAPKNKHIEIKEGQTISLLPPEIDDTPSNVPVYKVHLVSEVNEPPPISVAASSSGPDSLAVGNAAEEEGKSFNDRASFWARRKALDSRLESLTDKMECQLLRNGLTHITPSPLSDADRSLAQSVFDHVMERAERARWKADVEQVRAICDALPHLKKDFLHKAVSRAFVTDSGSPLTMSTVVGIASEMRKHVVDDSEETRADSQDATDLGLAAHANSRESYSPLILLIDEPLQSLPWESIPLLRRKPVCRLPCASFVGGCTRAAATLINSSGAANLNSAFYVLNPSGDLQRTQRTLQEQIAQPPRQGVVGKPPELEMLKQALVEKDVYIYCGHGDGRRYLPGDELQKLHRCPATILMGCSSGMIKPQGGFAPCGMAINYLHAQCPALVANLWDVTDGEIDRFTSALIESCSATQTTFDTVELLSAVARARQACRLRYLTGSAAVVYGVPLRLHLGRVD
ncbi:hypothetical protein AB1Y20_021828 [Prymnesium parvum]|uniref:separase n=1 Tax=Prymnesium parvum TaxID=97485 RepID=A0AB34JMJ0_PRYPA